MRLKIWNELSQIKYNENYCLVLLARQKRWLNNFNIMILIFSSAGIMGWALWKEIPFVACAIISLVQILKLLQVHIIPSDKQIEKLDMVTDFYFDYFNKLECLWYDYDNNRVTDKEAQAKYYELKATEKESNKILRDVIKSINSKIDRKANCETHLYLNTNFSIKS